jgi:hypothetical protein
VYGVANGVLPPGDDPFATITNNYGAVTSSPAILEVVPPGTALVAFPTPGALEIALAGPGPVLFACDGTITLTNTITIASHNVHRPHLLRQQGNAGSDQRRVLKPSAHGPASLCGRDEFVCGTRTRVIKLHSSRGLLTR